MMTSAEIRKEFLAFFASKKHQIVPSAPIVVKNDPTLLFTNAGMNQFKDYFLGNRKPEYKRIVDTQKCLRVSGKHNDLEEVGVDTYHHTMFEMLGNWSFGDYFKDEAIAWSWELLTEVYKIDKDRLYVSVFKGDESEGLPMSTIAYEAWKKLVPEDKIIFGNKKDNFWEMGDTGPCGPCSEIHVDCRSDEERKLIPGRDLVNNDHPQVIEIWNNVFMQYNRLKDGTLEPLPAKHVDTGMGFERLVRVLQGKQSNYDTDVFSGTIEAVASITGKIYDRSDSKEAVAFRVLADHIRAISFTIADGQLPSNTGAGYVIRRILRRAVRYYYTYLDYKQPLLFQLVPLLAAQFAEVFPELHAQEAFVTKVVKEEEDSFLRTLDKGLKRIDELMKASGSKTIEGKAAFELFDTYGFPIDLTRLIAQENNLAVDENGFEAEMQQQKNRSRAATAIDAADWIIVHESTTQTFTGYTNTEATTKVTKYRKVTAKGTTGFQIVLDTTPFYAESGGQVGDTGVLEFNGSSVEVIDTKKENNLVIHFTTELPATIEGAVVAKVNTNNRKNISAHHSATHLLHAALRQVLGTHVAQKGSLVNAAQLRFDFSHFAKVSDDEMKQIENIVNEKIRENIPVVIKEMSKDEAVALGAMALFGEKYGDTVRVVIMDPNYSIELCGGTHVGGTGELGLFKLKHESAVAAGVRRIEAVCGEGANSQVNDALAELETIKELVKNTKEPVKAVQQMVADLQSLKKRIESYEALALVGIKKELASKVTLIGDTHFIGAVVTVGNPDGLKKLCTELQGDYINLLVVLAANIEGKASVAVLVDDTLQASKGMEAQKIIKDQIAPLIKGGGGGQKGLATAGGQDPSNLTQAIESVKNLLN
ncbi:MAG: alanine--tRNA ligase [Sediminibacterium sp.]|nr:alanine--tRNA ligase [Sediminibacterium sp.]